MVITACIGAGFMLLLLTLVPLIYVVVLKDSDKPYRRLLGLVRAVKREHRCRPRRLWGRTRRQLNDSTDENTDS